METKKFSEASDAEIWQNFKQSEYQGTPLNRFLRQLANSDEKWCCKQIGRTKRVRFSDGTIMRVHFCPRCGKELQ